MKYLNLLYISVFLITLGSCSSFFQNNEGDKYYNHDMVGKWQLNKMGDEPAPESEANIYTIYNSDGTCEILGKAGGETYTWRIEEEGTKLVRTIVQTGFEQNYSINELTTDKTILNNLTYVKVD